MRYPISTLTRAARPCVLNRMSSRLAGAVLLAVAIFPATARGGEFRLVDDFNRPDSLYHGSDWETLNPGYWVIRKHALRRRLANIGNRNPITSFPWHWSNGGKEIKPRSGNRTPNLPMGILWRRDVLLSGNYTLRGTFTVRDLAPPGRGETSGFMGIAFGGESLYESRNFKRAPDGAASWMALWRTDGTFGLFDHRQLRRPVKSSRVRSGIHLTRGEQVTIDLSVKGDRGKPATLTATLRRGSGEQSVTVEKVDREKFVDGFLGIACYGALDFEVNRVELIPGASRHLPSPLNELHVCYPLGDTLQEKNGRWICKFVALFRSTGQRVDIRVAGTPAPPQGWATVPVAGSAAIVNHDWRRYTAVIDVVLPFSPAERTQYYTVWKDGADVTRDPRPAPRARGYLGPKDYAGRLPRLQAPYRVCTLGGHALFGGGTPLPKSKTYQENWIHGQPTQGAYQYFEDYRFQIINWDDDVWYLELLFPPPSTDDAYKIITLTIANPTTRWQMMRHWNVINPGDHDYGMDDIKGPEQILVRQRDDLGQDSEYMRRNFNINQHLVQGLESRVDDRNPKDWRRWKMPNGDFSLVVLEARNWRTSQDTDIWVRGGWGDKHGLYDRHDPTRTLLGEEQFAWLKDVVHTDTSPLICLSGVNCMHPIFAGQLMDPKTGYRFNQQDRVAADYAGWATAGTDRLLDLLGNRPGIVSVYGDIHLASIVEDLHQRVIECSCGPIGRGGSRRLKKDWAPLMKDYDGREVQIHALYHAKYDSPDLHPRTDTPMHWNFLEMEFDPRGNDPLMTLKIRNIIDPPSAAPRGGGLIQRHASSTGRPITCSLPPVTTLPNADVRFSKLDGDAILGIRSLADGRVPVRGLIGVPPHSKVLMSATDGTRADARIVLTSEVR